MKRVVSISLGSAIRDKSVELEWFGERILVERIGTNGDFKKAADLFKQLDGKVDAFGVGGADLGITVGNRYYPVHSTRQLVKDVVKTPVTDGSGIRNTLEYRIAGFLDQQIGDYLDKRGRNVFLVSGVERWGLSQSFLRAGYRCVFGDLMFLLGIAVPLHSVTSMKWLTAILAPVISRLPFPWIYPTGEKEGKRKPRFGRYFNWASVIAGDCHYLKRSMPDRLNGKVIVTNSTTTEDHELFRKAGVAYLITITPVFSDRSFGTNLIDAMLIAMSGTGRTLTLGEINLWLDRLSISSQIIKLN